MALQAASFTALLLPSPVLPKALLHCKMLPNRRKKTRTPIARNNRSIDNESTIFMSSFSCCCLASNSIGAICRAYARGDNYMIAFILFLYAGFLLLEWCLQEYHRLPPHKESRKKTILKTAIWVITTVFFFGLLHPFAPYFSLAGAVSAYAVAIASSACIFYVYFMIDHKKANCGCCRNGKMKSYRYSRLVEEVRDKKLQHSMSILDKV